MTPPNPARSDHFFIGTSVRLAKAGVFCRAYRQLQQFLNLSAAQNTNFRLIWETRAGSEPAITPKFGEPSVLPGALKLV